MAKRILVALDGTTASRNALTAALAEAKAHRAKLRLLYVVDELAPDPHRAGSLAEYWQLARAFGREALDTALARARSAGVRAETELCEIRNVGSLVRHIPQAILREAKRFRADLVVIGTHGRRGFNRILLGSVAEAVLRASSIPVLLVPSARKG